MNSLKTPKKISSHIIERRANPPALLRGATRIAYCALFCAAAAAHAADGYISDEAFRPPAPQIDSEPGCYRYGRCDDDSPRQERLRAQRLDRLAPQAPAAPNYSVIQRRDVAPTAAEEIQPAYKDAGGIREEYKDSGSRKDAPAQP